MLRYLRHLSALAFVSLLAACAADASAPPPPPPCDEACQDGVALRALRETTKLAFNLTLQGKPVGQHDLTTPCPMGGSVRVAGVATSNPLQGTTEVRLGYQLVDCGYLFKDDDPEDNYVMRMTGIMTQEGIIAVQPSATSALIMKSPSMAFAGTVHSPPIEYVASCPVEMGQNGNTITGTICGRVAKADL